MRLATAPFELVVHMTLTLRDDAKSAVTTRTIFMDKGVQDQIDKPFFEAAPFGLTNEDSRHFTTFHPRIGNSRPWKARFRLGEDYWHNRHDPTLISFLTTQRICSFFFCLRQLVGT